MFSDHSIVVNTAVTCPMPSNGRICRDNELFNEEEASDYRALVGSMS